VEGAAAAQPVLLAPGRGEGWRALARPASDARATRPAPGLWCLRLPLPYLTPGAVNCYLVALEDGWWLIDCGSNLAPGLEGLEHALALAEIELGSVRRLLVTHTHTDHAGLASVVIERTGCVYMRAAGIDAATDTLRDPMVSLERRRELGRSAGIPASQLDGWVDNNLDGDCDHPRPVADRVVRDGDRLDSAVGEWVVIAASGHSPTQIVLYNGERRWLIGADLAFPGAAPYLECGWSEDPYGEHLAALTRAAALEITLLLPGHGRPDEEANARLRDARDEAERFAARVLAALSPDGSSPFELALAVIAPETDADSCQAGLSTIVCVLEHFERAGRLRSFTDPAGVRRFVLADQPAAG